MSLNRKEILEAMDSLLDEMTLIVLRKKKPVRRGLIAVVLYVGAIVGFLLDSQGFGWACLGPGAVLMHVSSSAWKKLDEEYRAKKLKYAQLGSYLEGWDARERETG